MAADKTFGLRVYDLTGAEIISQNVGNLNNIDAVPIAADRHLLAASNRSTRSIDVFEARIDGTRINIRSLASIPLDLDDPYGLCMGLIAGSPTVFVGDKDGRVDRWEIAADFEGGSLVHSYRFASQTEGCVYDRVDSTLYVGEEAAGIWAVNVASGEKALIDAVGEGRLSADVEGLDIYYGTERLLIASSQGDNAYVIYRLPEGTPLSKFRITGNELRGVDGVTETDGVAVTALSLRDFPIGLLVVQDGHNREPIENQNFKLVDWRQIQDLADLTGAPTPISE
jgi:3-phytase